jgi:F0F1-type ATP synthase beta subunit
MAPYDGSPVAERSAHTDAEIDAAIEALSDPDRLEEAQRIVAARAPQLQRILDQALHSAGWFDEAHARAVSSASGVDDPAERLRAVRALVEEETRVSMLTGVAVGYELANTLRHQEEGPTHGG